MRYTVQLPDGTFVAFQHKGGTETTYMMPETDSVNAYDFGTEDAAKRWLVKWAHLYGGQVVKLTDSGHFPPED